MIMKSISNDRRPVAERGRDGSSPEFAGAEIPVLPKQSPRGDPEFGTESPGAEDFLCEIEAVAERAHSLAPEEHTWGFYAFSDGPVIAGGGTGGFLWFATREEMLDFIKGYLPFWCPGPDRSDVRQTVAKVREILRDTGTPTEALRVQLNNALKGYAQLVWWGCFGELLSAEAPFAHKIRDWFWSNGRRKKDGSGTVPREQARRFSERLQEYGL
jgi:hypothetical protein